MRVGIDIADQLRDVRDQVVRPTLDFMAIGEPRVKSDAAERLLLGTTLGEAWAHNLAQDAGGPARSPWQIEKSTHDWCVETVRARFAPLWAAVASLRGDKPAGFDRVAGDLYYACAVARLRYWLVPHRLPAASDVYGLALYWKRWFNTSAGAGDPGEFARRYRLHIQPIYAERAS